LIRFSRLKPRKNLTNLVDDLFSPEETLDLAQRLKIAKLIREGRTYEEIAAQIPVSTSTISKIGQVIKFGKGGFALLQNSTKAQKIRKGKEVTKPNAT